MYFDKLMHMVTSTHLKINTDTMDQYVVGPTALKMMMHMLSDELDRGAISMYSDATEARVHFQKDVTFECVNTIRDNHIYISSPVDHHEDVEGFVFPHLSKS